MNTHTVARFGWIVWGVIILFGCLTSVAGAETGGWLITPEEAAMAPAADAGRAAGGGLVDVGRSELSAGPLIEVLAPTDGGQRAMPVDVRIRFTRRSDPVDLASLKVTVIKFIPIDITDRVRPYTTPEGIEVKEAKIPSGKHRVRIVVADTAGGISIKEVSFEVL